FRPTSCLDYLLKGASACGMYRLYDSFGNSFPAYCDFKSEPGFAWTLVMSWAHKNRAWSAFRRNSFREDAPVNENSLIWNMYRLSLTRMRSLKAHSTHWRASCSYPTHGIDFTDYIRGNFKDFNIVDFIGSGQCKKVEFVNIRGHNGVHLTVRFWQAAKSYFLHTDSSSSGCNFNARSGSVSSEDNFGYYHTINPKFHAPVNENSLIWNMYRLSLTRMRSLKAHSTHWRASCSYPTHGIDFTDYIRGNFKDFNIVDFIGSGQCKKVEFVNIHNKKFHPTSCLDYLLKGASACGMYRLYDSSGNSFPAYCDFKSEPGFAWTLVMSWANKNRGWSAFRSTPFNENAPVNENSLIWNMYRLSLTRMRSLKAHSTHWRATCSYPTHGIDFTDYIRGNFKDFNIVDFIGSGQCKKVEFVNIRGHSGLHLTVRFWQVAKSYLLHTDSRSSSCNFNARSGSVSSGDYFGYYQTIN
ncbi:unnamed protein product, partial [Pocillopora meandrina]